MVTTAPGRSNSGKSGEDMKKFGTSTVTSSRTDWPT
jgi:hypothetical protein